MKLLNLPMVVALLAMAACGESSTTNTEVDTSSTIAIKDSAVVITPVLSAEDTELLAQDTLFEYGSSPSSWINAGFKKPYEFKLFLVQFKKWVKADNKDSIAAYINFPLKTVRSKADFEKNYHSIFNQEVKTAVDSLHFNRIFRNINGAMIGNGKIWFRVVKGQYRIIAINN